MAPSKQLKMTDQIKPARKDKSRPLQDGDDSMGCYPTPDQLSDTDTTSSSYTEAPASEKRLFIMLQELRTTLNADMKLMTAEFKRELADIGDRTDRLE
ncbi:Hypothetical predicted protein, partial [Pelobates cultripes]